MSARVILAFGDVHFPMENPEAVAVVERVAARVRPETAICLGDLLDCAAFSTHAPEPAEMTTDYEGDVERANGFLDRVAAHAGRLVLVEGNHEHRIARLAARDRVGKAAESLLSPRKLLMAGRTRATYVPYGANGSAYPHYRISPRLVAVHGWSVAARAAEEHLRLAQGTSVIHGHTHRADHQYAQRVFGKGLAEAVSAGCLCRLTPTYGTGSPLRWVNGFVLGYVGKESHTLYFIPIVRGRCVLPDGKEVSA